MYVCPNCGGNVKFDISKQKLFCYSCDNTYEAKSFESDKKFDYYETKALICPQCASQMLGDENEVAVFCSFCGASNVLEQRIVKEGRPQRIIPFKKTKEDCKIAYKKFINRNIYAPSSFKKEANWESFRGIYMPYWYYSVKKDDRIGLNGGNAYQRGDYYIHNIYRLEADVKAEFNGLTHDASSNFADYLSEEIAPFDEKEMVDFSPAYLSGFYADTFDVNKKAYDDSALVTPYEMTKKALYKKEPFREKYVSRNGNDPIVRAFYKSSDVKGYKAMFPVWFMSYRSKDRLYYSVVNGQTGKAYGDVPISPLKFIIYSLILAIPIWVCLSIYGYIAPLVCLFFACVMIFGIACLYLVTLKKLILKESKGDDMGVSDHANDSKNLSAFAQMDKYEEEYVKKKNVSPKKIPYMIIVWGILAAIITGITIYTAAGGLEAYTNQAVAQTGSLIVAGIGIVTLIRTIGVAKTAKSKNGKVRLGMIFVGLGLAIGAVCMFMHPVYESVYYIATIMVAVCSFGTIFDIINAHNMICSSTLPQFERKGGDDNA